MGFNLMGSGQWSKANRQISLPTGAVFPIPAGQYVVQTGPYTFVQYWDGGLGAWRNMNSPVLGNGSTLVTSDGTNVRLANLTGTVAGAVVTTGGTGYTNGIYPPSAQLGTLAAPKVTVAAGGGTNLGQFNIVVGGSINTTIAITAGGRNYIYPPILLIDSPPPGGVPASAVVTTITAGAIAAVTVTNAGAGYSSVPKVTIVNDPRDTTGSGGVLTVNATLALSGQVVCLTVADGGAGMTSVPAITFAPASTTAATAIMCWTATAVTWATPNHSGNGSFGLINSTITAGSNTSTNPAITTGMFVPRMGYTAYSTTASPTTTVIVDGGLHQVAAGAVLVSNSDGTINAATTTTPSMGGVNDTSYLLPL